MSKKNLVALCMVALLATSPADGREAQKLNTKPAMAGPSGGTGTYSPHDYPRDYSGRSSRYPNSAGQRPPTPQDQQLAILKADCERQRGTDCNNPATLQYMDSTSIPRHGRY